MPSPEELQGQIDSLTQRLNAALNRISDLEDFAGDHLGLDWGESLVDANSPHPNMSVNTIESGGGIIRQDQNGMQELANATSSVPAIFWLQQLSSDPRNESYHAKIGGYVYNSDEVGLQAYLKSNSIDGSLLLTCIESSGRIVMDWDSALNLSGEATPTTITSNQDDYTPTGIGSATVLRLSSDAARDITGMAEHLAGKLLLVFNVGSFNIVLKDESASSTAANRFALNGDITLQPDESAMLWYDATSQRWRC